MKLYRLAAGVAAAASLAVCVVWAADIRTQRPQIAASKSVDAGQQDNAEPLRQDKAANDWSQGPRPQWIWGPSQQQDRYTLSKSFAAPKKWTAARLIVSCDNQCTVTLNDANAGQNGEWNRPLEADVSKLLHSGENRLRIAVANQGGPAGLVAKLAIQQTDGSWDYVVSDASWQAQLPGDEQMTKVAVQGKLGDQPWGNVFAAGGAPAVADRGVFQTLPGFQVELLYTVPKNELGSWVCIAFDDKGRLLASDQGGKGICRITPPPIGSDAPTKVEKLNLPITSAQGMLHAFGSLYLSVNGGPGSGFYRARDTDGDDQYDELKKLKAFRGGGEHGPHAIRLGPDGKSLYVIAGNHTDPPAEFQSSRMPSNWSEDHLLPRQWDARGHARGKLAPGGWIAKTDADGSTWEMFSSGYRNPYDMDFNAEGELFAYDADMEWDMGTPWYRPTRAVHATSGSEFGWRSGTGKWPTYYADSLPPVVDIGPGSPVGVTFGYGLRFPAKYQRCLYLLDWTFGTIYAIHLNPEGASYQGQKEEFLSRTPLPLTDAAVGPDGALYFTVGGRGTQSELFRVTYTGPESTDPAKTDGDGLEALRSLRRQLESLHAQPDPQQLELIWKHLGHADRHIRFAARIALEKLDPQVWQQRIATEADPQTLLMAAIALARQGKPTQQTALLAAMRSLDPQSLSTDQRLQWYRALALTFIRLGPPTAVEAAALAGQLDPLYPADTDEENRELARVLVYLNSPTVIDKTLKLMQQPRQQTPAEISELLERNARYGRTIADMLANLPELQNIHYALVLRNMRYGWTLEQRKAYFGWLDQARQRSGGASYQGFIDNIRKEALANVSEAEQAALAAATPPPKPVSLPQPVGPGKVWSVEDVMQLAASGLQGRSFERGKRTFAAAKCVVCHRFDGNGGATGPDLTNAAGRFGPRDMAEALVEPSKVISDQYRATQIRTGSGKVITGRIVAETNQSFTVLVDPEDATKVVEVSRAAIQRMQPSRVSLMPADLLNPLNSEELADLLAYLMSRGNPQDPLFAK